MKTLAILFISALFAPICLSQNVTVQDSQNTVTINFEYGSVSEERSFCLDDFLYDEADNSYSLSIQNENLQLVRNFNFGLTYSLNWPPSINYNYSFLTSNLRQQPSYAPAIGEDWTPEPQEISEESVHVTIQISPLTLPLGNNYYMELGLESHYIYSYDVDGGFVHGAFPYPSHLGMANFWAILENGSDALIQGGVIYGSIDQPRAPLYFVWRIFDWWMPEQVIGMKITNEFWASDLTIHRGSAYMLVNRHESLNSPNLELEQTKSENSSIVTADVVPEIN